MPRLLELKDLSPGFKITKIHRTKPANVANKRTISIWNGVTHFHKRNMYEVTKRHILPISNQQIKSMPT